MSLTPPYKNIKHICTKVKVVYTLLLDVYGFLFFNKKDLCGVIVENPDKSKWVISRRAFTIFFGVLDVGEPSQQEECRLKISQTRKQKVGFFDSLSSVGGDTKRQVVVKTESKRVHVVRKKAVCYLNEEFTSHIFFFICLHLFQWH